MDHLKIVIVKSLELSLIICQNWQLDLIKWDFSCEHNKIAKNQTKLNHQLVGCY